mmetsp:Transcript_20992/g.18322  ORF Transcript_20992/g.18322 Transcript_20992/m.18322 type:complete len:129 (+) Transcript_20992:413-799(+)
MNAEWLLHEIYEAYEAINKFNSNLTSPNENTRKKLLECFKSAQKFSAPKIKRIMDTYPAGRVKFRIRDGDFKVTQLTFNQKYIDDANIPRDQFINQLFSKGIPGFALNTTMFGSKALSFCLRNSFDFE